MQKLKVLLVAPFPPRLVELRAMPVIYGTPKNSTKNSIYINLILLKVKALFTEKVVAIDPGNTGLNFLSLLTGGSY